MHHLGHGPLDRLGGQVVVVGAAGQGVLWYGTTLLDPGMKGEGSLETRLTTPAVESLDVVTDFRLAAVRGEIHLVCLDRQRRLQPIPPWEPAGGAPD